MDFCRDAIFQIDSMRNSETIQEENLVTLTKIIDDCISRSIEFDDIVDLIKRLCFLGYVPSLKNETDILKDNCFGKICKLSECCLECVTNLITCCEHLTRISDEHASFEVSKIAYVCIILVKQHIDPQRWNSIKSLKLASELSNALMSLARCHSLCDLIIHDTYGANDTVTLIIQFLMKYLNKNSWMKNVPHHSVFLWLLNNLEYPKLRLNFNFFMSAALNFVDHFENEYKLKGINCIRSLILKVPRVEFEAQNRYKVISDALQHQLYIRDPYVIDLLIPCLLEFLHVCSKFSIDYSLERLDEIAPRFLTDMYLENNLDTRRMYAKHMSPLILFMGIRQVIYLPRIFKVVESYLETPDGKDEIARVAILDVVEVILIHSWPRLNNYIDQLLKNLIRILFDIFDDENSMSADTKDCLKSKIINCIRLLEQMNPCVVNSKLKSVTHLNLDVPLKTFLKNILMPS